MITITCDVCGVDLTTHKEAWAMNISEYKHNENTLLFHLCDEHQKAVADAIAGVVKEHVDASKADV